ncbi:DUF6760 family protein [Natronobiforma cellulositropha]|uniref:DUF6760 family protein n=1 Tax=Natronobiforma cellulositropha TaxID=1679076 RepID=UPI0029500453|nr:DUF6760 family protein [Natronobiforma cellulositropha]
MSVHPADQLYEEVAFIAYYFNWAHEDVLALPHWERRRWCDEISRINQQMNEGDSSAATMPMEPTFDNLPL